MPTSRAAYGRLRSAALLAGLAAFAIATSGCTPGQALLSRKAHTARENLVGISRDEVIRCAGSPMQATQRGRWEYLSYLSAPPPPSSDHTRCVTTFRLQGGYVESIDYETPNGNLIGQSISECLDTVGPCLNNLANVH